MEVWIEILISCIFFNNSSVTSLVEVWIEMIKKSLLKACRKSLPLWKCGLKSMDVVHKLNEVLSLPLWKCGLKSFNMNKAELLGRSLPLWKCGLKSSSTGSACRSHTVTSLVEVWIEIPCRRPWQKGMYRSLPLWKCGLKYV